MQALLLAAGRSRRFAPLPDKNFLRLGEKTLLEYQIAALKKAGVKKVVIAAGAHNAEGIRALVPTAVVVEQAKLDDGMAGAIVAAREELNEPTVVLSTNDIFDPTAIKKIVSVKNADGALLAHRVKTYFPGGYLKLSEKNRIESIVEKPRLGSEPSDLVTIVCHFFREPAVFAAAVERELGGSGWFKKQPKTDDAYERALGTMFRSHHFVAVEYAGAWQAVKYPWHVLSVTEQFLATLRPHRSKSAKIAKTAVVSGPVVIEDGVKIFDHAVVKGPAYLAKNVVVGTGALVRDSIIGEASVVGSNTEVARSYVGAHVWFHRNYVGDSVIADNVSFGSGAVTGNLRLDEGEITATIGEARVRTGRTKLGTIVGEGCRVGVNTSLMPGVSLGENTFVGSGLTIDRDIPARSFVKGKMVLEVVENRKTVAARKKM